MSALMDMRDHRFAPVEGRGRELRTLVACTGCGRGYPQLDMRICEEPWVYMGDCLRFCAECWRNAMAGIEGHVAEHPQSKTTGISGETKARLRELAANVDTASYYFGRQVGEWGSSGLLRSEYQRAVKAYEALLDAIDNLPGTGGE